MKQQKTLRKDRRHLVVCDAPRIKDKPHAQPCDLVSASAMSGNLHVFMTFPHKDKERKGFG